MTSTEYRSVYTKPGAYDQLLLPHYFDGVEDTDIARAELRRLYGPPGRADLRILEIGCGTGRMTDYLKPYAKSLIATDFSATMTDAVQARYPDADARPVDALRAVEELTKEGHEASFDVVAAFWSLSYPIGECFEAITDHGISVEADIEHAYQRAHGFIGGLIRLLAPGGSLLALLFDADTAEQRLVTQLWDRLAPHPAGGRDLSKRVIERVLRETENDGDGHLTWHRRSGVAVAENVEAARRWFLEVHLKSHPALAKDPAVREEVERFIAEHRHTTGSVLLPSGVHLITFTKNPAPACHLPAGGRQ